MVFNKNSQKEFTEYLITIISPIIGSIKKDKKQHLGAENRPRLSWKQNELIYC